MRIAFAYQCSGYYAIFYEQSEVLLLLLRLLEFEGLV